MAGKTKATKRVSQVFCRTPCAWSYVSSTARRTLQHNSCSGHSKKFRGAAAYPRGRRHSSVADVASGSNELQTAATATEQRWTAKRRSSKIVCPAQPSKKKKPAARSAGAPAAELLGAAAARVVVTRKTEQNHGDDHAPVPDEDKKTLPRPGQAQRS